MREANSRMSYPNKLRKNSEKNLSNIVQEATYAGPDLDNERPGVANLWHASVAYAGFFNGGISVTSHRDDVKILHYNYSSLEVLKCLVL